MNKEKVHKRFRERIRSLHLVNITMHSLDEILQGKSYGWRGWKYPDWTDEELTHLRELLYMHKGYLRYRKEKKRSTPVVPYP